MWPSAYWKKCADLFVIGGRELYTSVSIGIICCTGLCGSAEEVLRDADLTMYRAKSQGKARYEIFDNELQEQAIELLTRETEFRRAMARKEFELFYQPIVDLASGEVVSLEALVRWRHPQRGLVLPGEFIPIAEDNGQILPLGRWVLIEACARLADLQGKFPRAQPLCMSVNISAKQFLQADLSLVLNTLLDDYGLDPATVELEITESVVMEKGEASIERLRKLKTLGVKLFVDDFGTGYSSLAYLHRFSIDMLKIDKSFITEIDASGGHTEIVRAIAGLGRNLGLGLIAEGVETKAQLEAVRAMGCHRAQGFYFARPMPVDELEKFLSQPIRVPDD